MEMDFGRNKSVMCFDAKENEKKNIYCIFGLKNNERIIISIVSMKLKQYCFVFKSW